MEEIARNIGRECFINYTNCSQRLEKELITRSNNRRLMAEVGTPYNLRNEMINSIPKSFWKNKEAKVFDPAVGKGGFIIDVIWRFMDGLSKIIPNKESRYKYIIENCVFWADLNPLNIRITEAIINPDGKYKTNYYQGSSIEINTEEVWGIKNGEWDLIIGNPPFQKPGQKKGRNRLLYPVFVERALTEWLKPGGYLLFVHPSLWRQYQHPFFELMNSRQIIYLEIHNMKDGLSTFHAATRYDWYLIKNEAPSKPAVVVDEDGIKVKIKQKDWKFLPNAQYRLISKLVHDKSPKLDVEYSRSAYGTDKKWIHKNQSSKAKYPVVYSTYGTDGLNLLWSDHKDNGHFDRSKIIFSNGTGIVQDPKGKYGLTQWAYAIYDSPSNLAKLEKMLRSDKFKKLKDSIQISSSSYNIPVMSLLPKNLWNYI